MNNEERAKIYWKKSAENLAVSRVSFQNNHYNAAASRYYYALYQAFFALFEFRGISVNKERQTREGMKPNPNPNVWTKNELHNQAKIEIKDYKFNVHRILKKAAEKRVKGDYKDMDVEFRELEDIQRRADGVFLIIDKEINKK
ncbi:hypothetical protein J7L05_05210 [bacterium]|nr:hypothetical protein [bacterium]